MQLMLFALLFMGPALSGEGWFENKRTGHIGPSSVLRAWAPSPDSEEPIGYVLDVSVSPDGGLAVLEGKDSRVYIWRPDGSFHTAVSRDGQGPGELTGPNFVALGNDHLFVYQFAGEVSVFYRKDDYAMTTARKFNVARGFPRVFQVLAGEKLLLGRSKAGLEMEPLTAQIMALDGTMSELTGLRKTPKFPLWNVINMSDPNEKLPVGMARLWACRRKAGGFYYGFSDTATLHQLDRNGRPVDSLTLKLPRLLADADDIAGYMDTPIAIIEKSPKDLNKEFGMQLKLDTDSYMSFYTQFLDYGSHFLIFVTPMGGFQMADFLLSGDRCQYYDPKTKTVQHRGRLALAEDVRLFVTEDSVVRIRFDENDLMVAESVRLDWVAKP